MVRRRNLNPEELELWQAVARTARPMHKRKPPAETGASAPVPALKPPTSAPSPPQARVPLFALGERSQPRPQTAVVAPKPDPVQMDAKAHGRMVRGKLVPEARIDLHGMTLAEAHPELIAFLLGAHSRSLRLILVITGKGKMMHEPVPRPIGALRHQVPHWLRLPPLSHVVLQVTEAHLKHGGSGAFYVYLRRR